MSPCPVPASSCRWLSAAMLACCRSAAPAQAAQPPAGFTPLFNGRDLAGGCGGNPGNHHPWHPRAMKTLPLALAAFLLAPLAPLPAAEVRTGGLRIVSREVTRQPSPFYGALYAEPKGLRLINGEQASDDNGKTWTANPLTPDFARDLPPGYRRTPVTAMLDPRAGCVLQIVNALDTPGLDPKINEPPSALQNYYLRYRVSADGGRTWLFEEPVIQQGDYTALHPIKDVWIGQNALFLGDRGCIPIATRDGKILVPAQMTLRGENGKLANPGGGHTYTDVVVLIGAWTRDHRVQWQVSERVQGDPARTSRGVIEPTLVETGDGRLLMVMRGSNDAFKPGARTAVPPGRKWFATSTDGGVTWTKPEAWAYDDGEAFYSPSSMSTLFRHSTGRIFWMGNLLSANPEGNLPRHPLVIGEVDRKTLRLIRSSVVTLDQEEPGDKPQGRLDLSHFHLIEDRQSREIILHLAPRPQSLPEPRVCAGAAGRAVIHERHAHPPHPVWRALGVEQFQGFA